MSASSLLLGLSLLLLCAAPAHAQRDAAEEALYRAEALQRLPPNAARRLFSLPAAPARLPAQALGAYGKGCVAGALQLDPEGPGWQVMRPARGRYFGHPTLVAFIQELAGGVRRDGRPDLLIGDMAQPRGGPMLTGHESHQLGLEVDLWLTPGPADRLLTLEEREYMDATDMVRPDLLDVNPDFTRLQLDLLRRVASRPEVDRIFVNAAIKQAACRQATQETGGRAWLRRLRPWQGHTFHMHVALKCPNAGCANRFPVPPGEGCGRELDAWFRPEVRFPKPRPVRPPRILTLKDLPRACGAVLAAP